MDYKELEYLRRNTRLRGREKKHVKQLRNLAMDRQRIINEVNHCCIAADFTEAEAVEFRYRMTRFALDNYYEWLDHNDGLSLYDFACKKVRDNKDKEYIERRLIRR